jgi:predicted enzyme related to lactoylglutathione lyase
MHKMQHHMKFQALVSIRIITNDVRTLAGFYEQITGLTAIYYTEDFAELKTPCATLAIGSTRTLQLFGGDEVAKAAQNRSAIIEFMVADVDAEYARLTEFQVLVVQAPILMPWGNKSLLLRDPDGNLVNLFTPVAAEAIKRFEEQ